MFHTLLSQTTYEDVETFCRTWTEGVRVEYKREPKHIPKVVSSFANTVGGIWVIGADADKVTNRPKLPLVGMKRQDGIEEQIVQSSQTGIYPPITPDVRVLEIPGKPDQIIALVKVAESTEAPHAIEGSTKVYIRNASTTDPYQLADIDRIAYFIKRREEPEKRREELIRRIASRSLWRDVAQRIRVVVAPIYPRGVVLPADTLLERAQLLENQGNQHLSQFRLVHDGILSTGRDPQNPDFHFEATMQGIVYYERQTKGAGQLQEVLTKAMIPYIHLHHLLNPLGNGLNTALTLLKGSTTNVMVRYELGNWGEMGLIVADRPMMLVNPGGAAAARSLIDSQVSVSENTILETLPERRADVITDVMRRVLWAFNYTTPDLRARVDAGLRALNLI